VLRAAWKVSESEVAIVVEPRVLSSHEIQWDQKGNDIDGEAAGDYSGTSVSLSNDGTVVAIGADSNDGNGFTSGHVRIYAWGVSSSWVQMGADIDGEAGNDLSGGSVSLSNDGTVVAIGALGNDGNGASTGHVRIYAWDSPSWVQMGADIDGEAAVDDSGYSVSLSSDGTVVAIGARYNDGNGFNSGHVRVYAWDDSTSWDQMGADIDGEARGDLSGWSVSLSSDGTVVAIGAYANDGNGSRSGHVRVYAWGVSSSWVQRGADIDGEDEDDVSGDSVSLSNDGTVVAIGALGNDGNGSKSGHVRVYVWISPSWVQRGADIDGEDEDDLSGVSVSLSNDGTVVAIGAEENDGNGSNSGHVRVYAWAGSPSSWVQMGADIDGEAAGDYSGTSVSLSSDGTVVAIGAYGNGGVNGNASGHVRVYSSFRTFNIVSSFKFDDSRRQWCLQAKNVRVNAKFNMRPCIHSRSKQKFYLDEHDQLRLRDYPTYCMRWKKKAIYLGYCPVGTETSKAKFIYEKDHQRFIVQKPRFRYLLGVSIHNKYEKVRLFKQGGNINDSTKSWSLQFGQQK